MEHAEQIRAAETARALGVKRRNAITAVCTGAALSAFALKLFGIGPLFILPLWFALGTLGGILYANAFEYVLHRFLLHWGQGFLVQRHALHHDSAGAPNEARYVNFATSPLVVILVFALNALPVFAVARFFSGAPRGAAAARVFAGFTLYFVLYEEIHWRIHFGGWLPRRLRFARRHHLLHHGGFHGRYNVFLPIFDWLFHRGEWKTQASR